MFNHFDKIIWESLVPKWCVLVLMKKFNFQTENELFELIAKIKDAELESELKSEFEI